MSTIKKELIVKNEQGLHARPASIFVQRANKYPCEIRVKKGEQEVNGKSIMGILTLEAGKGSKIRLEIEGVDAEKALEELKGIILGEEK